MYRFDATEPNRRTPDDEQQEQTTGVVLSENRSRQMQGLFQIMYHDLHQGRKRTPFHIMNNQAIYDACKSKCLITSFSRFGLRSGYDELMRHQNDIASFTVANSTAAIPFPSHFDKRMFTMGAFDNFDHDEANLSGMGGNHDTVTVLFQDDGDSLASKPKRSETNIQHGPKAFNVELKCQEMKQFSKPSKKPDLPEEYTVPTSHSVYHDLLGHGFTVVVQFTSELVHLLEFRPFLQYLGEVFFSLVNSAFIHLGAKVLQVVLWICHQGSKVVCE